VQSLPNITTAAYKYNFLSKWIQSR